jgi:predicted KAP-like P-loop ATPase
MSNDTSQYATGMIIVDDVTDKPILDFEAYSNTIVKMIEQSPPRFSIGIYGEWGTGKTTLMKTIQTKLDNRHDEIPTLWFNAWRYEGEKIHATIPLLLTIMNALEKQLEKEKAKIKSENTSTRKKITDNLSKMKRYRNMFSGSLQVGIPGIISGTLNVTPEKIDKQKKGKKGLRQMEEQKPTIQEGIELIEEVKSEIKSSSPRNLKLVVFIDDLDRCCPKKALEVFESIKVF